MRSNPRSAAVARRVANCENQNLATRLRLETVGLPESFETMLKSFCLTLLAGVLCVLGASHAAAYEPTVDEIVTRFLEKTPPTTRAIFETRSVVFDPFATGEPAADAAEGATLTSGVGEDEEVQNEQPERAFIQTTYWIRNSFLAVETFSTDGELLHFYLGEKFKPISLNQSADRPFADWDVLSPYLPFLEAGAEGWREGLDRWGVQPERVEFIRTPKGLVYFKLVEGPGKSVWVDRFLHRPLKIETVIEGGPEPLRLTIEFGEFMLFGDEEAGPVMFPRTINYLLDGRLFKQTTVRRFENEPPWARFPLTRLRRKGRELLEASAAKDSIRGEG